MSKIQDFDYLEREVNRYTKKLKKYKAKKCEDMISNNFFLTR